VRPDSYGVYSILKSMEQGPMFRVTVSKYPTKYLNYRIFASRRSRFTTTVFTYDTLGHPVVDLLRTVAQRLRENICEVNLAARFGGNALPSS
jgi:GGDEF domain-containing protein